MFSDRFAVNAPQAPGPRVATEGIPRNLFNQPLIEPSQVELVPQGSGAMLRLVPSRKGKDGKMVPLTADELRAAAQADPSRFSGAAIRDSENRLIDAQNREEAGRVATQRYNREQFQQDEERRLRGREVDARIIGIEGTLKDINNRFQLGLETLRGDIAARQAENLVNTKRAETEALTAENQGSFWQAQAKNMADTAALAAKTQDNAYQLGLKRFGLETQQFEYGKEQDKRQRMAGYLGMLADGLNRITL